MKIILVITDYGSFNNFIGELAISLVKKGNEVTVITSQVRVIDIQDKFDYRSLGIKFKYVDFPRGFNPLKHFKSSKKIQHIIKEIHPDLVHIHFATGIFTTLFSGKLNYKTVGTFHGLGFPVLSGLKKRIFGAVEKFCFNRLDFIYVLNEVDYCAVRNLGYQNVLKYETLGLGCDLGVFNPSNYSDNQKVGLKKELAIQSKNFVFAFTGRFVEFKGYDKVIRSFLYLNQKYPDTRLLLIGGKDKIHTTGLSKEEEENMGACPNIINIGFTKDVAKYLSITDVFVFPSLKEGMPVCVIEALAMGVPVITADSRGCNEIIKDLHNGAVVDIRDDNWNKVAFQMEALINNPDRIETMKSNIKRDRELYDRNRYVICELNRYNNLINTY